MILFFIVLLVLLLFLFIFCSFVVSSEQSRKEDEYNINLIKKNQKGD